MFNANKERFKTLTFKDSVLGRSKMQAVVDKHLSEGWRVIDTDLQSGRRSVTRTVGYGVVFLPLAIKGKKKDTLRITLERV